MLATSPFHTPTPSPPFAFLPTHPSPLSPRSANIHGPRAFMSPTPNNVQMPSGQENAHLPFSRRAVKKAPTPKQDELKERRRNLFLKKVKEGREDRRFETRGEDIMRLDFMQRRKQWEAERARDAPTLPSDCPEPEDEGDACDLPSSQNATQLSQPSTQLPGSDEEADEVAQMEDQELEALLGLMSESGGDGCAGQQAELQNLWSDDDDYDELFSELMEQDGGGVSGQQQQQQQKQQQQQTDQQDGEEMDMS